MATLTVTTNADSGTGSLRQTIADAAAGDTIVFDSTVFPAGTTTAIPLASTLTVSKTLTIDAGDPVKSGEGAQLQLACRVALDGQNAVSVAKTNTASTQISWHGVCFRNGKTSSGSGGGLVITSTSTVSLTECVFSGNSAKYGGGLHVGAYPPPTLTRCVFNGNYASYYGGGMYSVPGYTVTLIGCVFNGNSANYHGGGIYANSDSLTKSIINFHDGNIVNDELYIYIYDSSRIPQLDFSGYNGIGIVIKSGSTPMSVTGSGFLALPSSAPIKLPSTITRTVYGAGVSNLTSNNLTLSWSSTDSTKSVLLEKQNGANWDTVSTSATSPNTVLSEGVYRIWDGATFLTQSVIIPPQTLVVTNTNDSGSGSLRAALASARAVDTVTFDASLSGSTITLASGLTITNAVEIVGLVDANGKPDITISGANTYRILSGDYKMTLSNLVFEFAGDHAIYNENADGSSFTNCDFIHNSATDSYGGAVLLMGNNPASETVTFTDCRFTLNESIKSSSMLGFGGAVTTQYISAVYSGCDFTSNTAGGAYGGAVAQFSPTATISLTNCTFTGNTTIPKNASSGMKDSGGAVYAVGTLTASGCTFDTNSVDNVYDGDEGGAVYLGNDGTLTNCTFTGNFANTNGGAICTYYANVKLPGCTFSGNTAANGADYYGDTSSDLTVQSGIVTIPNVYIKSSAGVGIANGAALSISNSATILGSVGAITRGYLATPPGTDLTSASLTNIVACDYGAGVSTFSIDEDSADWTAVNSNISVLLEKKVNNAWQTLAQPTGTSYSTTFVDGDEARIFDGVQFRTASAVVPTTLVVTNTNPTGAGSLSQAVIDARAVDTITFDPSLAGETITLNAGLGPRNEVTIVGLVDSDGNPAITVDGNGNYTFNSSYPVHISNVEFNGGWGAFSSAGGFDGSTFENCTFENMDLNVFELATSSQTAESVSFTDCVFSSNDAADVLIDGNVNVTLSGGNVLNEGFDLTDAGTVVINNAGYNGVGGYTAPTAGTASVAGSGHIALPDAATPTIAQTVTRSEYGASLTAISANNLTISWTATDATKSVLLEVQNGADWDTIDDDATSPATVSTDGKYRVWDGVVFLTIDVQKTRYWQVRAWADMTAGGGGIGDASPAWIVTNKTTGPNLNGN